MPEQWPEGPGPAARSRKKRVGLANRSASAVREETPIDELGTFLKVIEEQGLTAVAGRVETTPPADDFYVLSVAPAGHPVQNANELNQCVTRDRVRLRASAPRGERREELALRFTEGKAVIALTKKGWKIAAKLASPHHWPDETLNAN